MQLHLKGLRAGYAFCLAAPLVLVLASCGGGGEGVVGSGGTGTGANTTSTTSQQVVSVGPITGFGSIIVNGVKYDDSAASVSHDDSGGLTRSDLRLGMFVEVRGSANSATALGTATSVIVRSELKGVVTQRTASTFVLLGVTVRTDASTVYDNAANVVDGDFVEVYGVFDAGNRSMLASRVERKVVAEHKLRGVVAALDTVTRRFSIGATLIDYTNAGTIPGLANGAELQVYGAPPPASGAWPITRASVRSGLSVSSVSRVELKAVVEQFASLSNFRVAGVTVDGSAATIEGGTAAQLTVGRRIELKGDVVGSVVKASRIKIEDDSGSGSSSGGSSGSSGSSGSGSGSSSGAGEFEVKGTISGFVSAASFLVRGTRIDASGSVSFEDGSAAQLRNGACVEVKGALGSTASGSAVVASRIKFDDDC